ncbi:MAG TPA: lanthionine synthetase LanC family protein [Gemmatimonadales bacterium]|nr:lanthionine synthetase LanC family protein [Gemmatimonadales bacterium]
MTLDPHAALSVSGRIADHLCDTAFRYGDQCTWMGMTQDTEDGSDQVDFTYGTLGPDLYGGSSGVALFLSQAFRQAGERRWRDTALAGIAHALDRLDTIPPPAQAGFYTGHVGVAYAAALIGRALERGDLEARAVAVLDCLGGAADGELVVDLVSGGTGAIAPLLALAVRLDRPALGDLAMRLGRRTVAAATRSDDGWSWPVTAGAIDAARALTGLAHGAAGIGWSLLELGVATGAGEMIEAAHQAFRYENRWFRPAEDNWPDFREEDGDDAPACVAWCHGAPGIGLTRLRAVELGVEAYRADAEAAMRTTRSSLADRDCWIDGDFSLCHGHSGLGEILRYASRVLGRPESDELVWEAAAAGAARFADEPASWPCGVRQGSNPSLMIGLAGIGHFFLGLTDPALPSVLLVRPPARPA